MVRTGARAAALGDLLASAGLDQAPPPPRPDLGSLPEDLGNEVLAAYASLGGAQESPRLRVGPWDLSFDEELVVELDEELHFNRYRARTLNVSWARKLPWREDYLSYCAAHEEECRAAASWGKRWTNSSCEPLFGKAGPPGDLAGAGAPRWKQRALYDAIKDLAPLISPGLRLARLSVYDRLDGASLGDLLYGESTRPPAALRELVEARTAAIADI